MIGGLTKYVDNDQVENLLGLIVQKNGNGGILCYCSTACEILTKGLMTTSILMGF